MNKRGQLTIIIIIGVVLLVVFIVFQMAFSGAKEAKTGRSVQKVVDSGLDIETIQTFGNECVGKAIQETIEQQNNELRTLYYDTTGADWHIKTIKSSFTSLFKKNVNDSFGDCFDTSSFENRGVTFQFESYDISKFEINKEDISAVMTMHIRASYRNQTATLNEFYFKYPTNFSMLINSSEQILLDFQDRTDIDCTAANINLDNKVKAKYYLAYQIFNLSYENNNRLESFIFKPNNPISVRITC